MAIPRKLRVIPALLLLLLASASSAAARWQPAGPEGGNVTSLAIDLTNPRVLYAAAGAGGVFKSADAGATWAPAFEGLRGVVRIVAVDPGRLATVYAGTDLEVFRSDDGAAHWTATPLPIPELLPVNALLATPGAVYINLVSNSPAPVAIGFLFKSTDRGASWSPLGTGGFVMTALAADPANSNVLYAGSHTGVFRSADGGLTWTAASGGLPAGADVTALLAPAPGTLYAALTRGAKVFRSTDGGSHWQRVSRGIASPSLTAFAAGLNPAVLYVAANATAGTGSLFRTMDGGAHWQRADAGLPTDLQALVLDPQGRTLFAGSRIAGVLRSGDGATTWKTASHGLRAVPADAVVADPKRPAILFAGTPDFGLIKTTDGGASWRGTGVSLGARKPLAIDPQRPATVYASSRDTRLLRSRDGGRSWQRIRTSPFGVNDLAVDPGDPSILYASGFFRIDRSTDGGDTWIQDYGSPCALPGRFAITPTSRVFNAAFSACGPNAFGLGIHERGPDGGWREVNNGLPIHPSPDGLGADPRQPSTVYAAIQGYLLNPGPQYVNVYRMYRTTDGENWTQVAGLGENEATAFAFPPAEPGVIYAAVGFGFGLLVSEDGGETWHATGDGLPQATVSALAVGPGNPAILYAASPGGLYRLIPGAP
jgi:photosystem II stability/assembly factor-like uncharacterized protein